jgi:A/G-specific adenine glycosylase
MSKRSHNAYDDATTVAHFRTRHVTGKRNGINLNSVQEFRNIMYEYYRKYGRDFPWRHTRDSYYIVVSEIMLQQTQTDRVVPKFEEFINAFPTVKALATSSLRDVLMLWQGMGYNRRARHLHQLATKIIESHDGRIPDTTEELTRLPGIGKATAAAICAFAFNKPVVFVETNIRTVFIHFFFHSRKKVSDHDILVLAEAMLDQKNPRRFYSALMDYGAMLKKKHPNPSRKSAHHQKQTRFEGSRRQLRGLVLRTLLAHRRITVARLSVMLKRPQSTVSSISDELATDGLITRTGNVLTI